MRIGVIHPEFFRRAARNDATPISSGEATPETYGNVDLIDGTARVDQPELLLYEPARIANYNSSP